MPYNISNTEGIDFAAVFYQNSATPDYPAPNFAVGQTAFGTNGTGYVFVSSAAAFAAGDVVTLSTAFVATTAAAADTTTFGMWVGVVPSAVTAAAGTVSASYFWVQRFGVCPAINVATGVTANQALYTSGTAGRLDASAATGDEIVPGLVSTATAASNLAAGMLNWPTIGVTT